MEPAWKYSIAQTMGLLRGLEADPEDNDLKAKMILAWATFAYYVDAPEIKTVVGFPPQHVDALKWVRLFIALRQKINNDSQALQDAILNMQNLLIQCELGKHIISMMKVQLQQVVDNFIARDDMQPSA